MLDVWVATHTADIRNGDGVEQVVLADHLGLTAAGLRDLRRPGVRVVLLIRPAMTEAVRSMIAEGVEALVTTADSADAVRLALHTVAANGFHISPTAAELLLSSRNAAVAPTAHQVSLTSRETAVLEAMVDGLTVKATARALGVSDKTVEAHRRRVFDKLRATNHAEAVAVALRRGLVSRGRR